MPPVPCPCCKAANPAGPACRRCKADLTLLFAVAAEQEHLVAEAAAHLRAGDGPAAAGLLDRALDLRRTPAALKLRAVAAVASRDYPAAVSWYSAAVRADSPAGAGGA